MPHARLTYRLPDEEREFAAACQGEAALALLAQIDSRCREVIKYEHEPHRDRMSLAQEIRDIIRDADGVDLS